MKKLAKKNPASRKAVTKSPQREYLHIISITFVAVLVVLVGAITAHAVTRTQVLGMASGPRFLADQGDTGNNITNASQDQKSQDQNKPSGTDSGLSNEPAQIHAEAPAKSNKIEIATEKQPLGNDALTKINDALKEKDIQVGTNSAEGFTIKSHGVEAETHFPLSVNPATNALSVTTPAGTKTVTVLPNQAVQNLLQHQVLSAVSQSTASGAATPIILTQIDNQPAFAVKGVSDKKLFGIFPISLNKTVFVSAQTGTVLQTQQSFIDQILNALSF